ncbi:hypothetical protein EZV62_007436 [Acer yangbiense]|uniref:Uncharacterized protein n=1 Tax=Acer yangbiense TaxID=1000413 RepID=A0A5C7IAP8_9ROSI|nr:hypothetical protein EZV62_007436 [Acer yangbiense]
MNMFYTSTTGPSDDVATRTKSPLPYLSPELTGKRLLIGANFASAGIGILNDTGIQFLNMIRMFRQLDYFEGIDLLLHASTTPLQELGYTNWGHVGYSLQELDRWVVSRQKWPCEAQMEDAQLKWEEQHHCRSKQQNW